MKMERPGDLKNLDREKTAQIWSNQLKQLGEIKLEDMTLSELKDLYRSVGSQLVAASNNPDFDWADDSYQRQLDQIKAVIEAKGDKKFAVN